MKDRVDIDELKRDSATFISDDELELIVDGYTTDPELLSEFLELTDELVDALADYCLDQEDTPVIVIIRDQAKNHYFNL